MKDKHVHILIIALIVVCPCVFLLFQWYSRAPSDERVMQMLTASPWRLQSISWGDQWMGDSTNEWFLLLTNKTCIYHAPYPFNSHSNHLSYSDLQTKGHLYSQGFDTPEEAIKNVNPSELRSTSHFVQWNYVSGRSDPERFEAIERAFAIIELSFFVNGDYKAGEFFRINSGLGQRLKIRQHCRANDGNADMEYVLTNEDSK